MSNSTSSTFFIASLASALLDKLGILPVTAAGLIYYEPDYSDPEAVVDAMSTCGHIPFPFKADDV